MQLTTRNATLADLAALLEQQHARKIDMVVPAAKLRSSGASLVVEGAEALIESDGVTDPNGVYVPTVVCDEGIAEKLGIPSAYLKKIRESRPDLYDANVNGWLSGSPITGGPIEEYLSRELPSVAPTGGIAADVVEAYRRGEIDPRSFLLRCFRGDGDTPGVARAFLSNAYKTIDDLDVLTAALEGIRDAGAIVDIRACDLTERRMYVRVAAPEIAVLAPKLLAGYRSPFDGDGRRAGARGNVIGAPGHEYRENVVFAGFEISNSEVGGGSFQIVPRIVVEICDNGLKVTKDALREVHLGGRLDDGVVRWSADTQNKQLALIAAQARDAVATFLDVDYVSKVIDEITEKAETPIRGDAAETVKHVGKTLRFSEERIAGVLDHFIRGGQMTAGGVMQAVTSYAQVIENADEAAEVEAAGLRALEVAARAAR